MKGPVEKDDDIYLIVDFMKEVRKGYFTDYDGHGEWATFSYKFGITVHPSELIKMTQGEVPLGATHIVWYNK